MLIKTEEFVDEDGVRMCKEFFGSDEENITCVITRPVIDESSDSLPEIEDVITEEEFQAQLLLNQTEIIAKQEEQDEVLAEILLNQMGGEENV